MVKISRNVNDIVYSSSSGVKLHFSVLAQHEIEAIKTAVYALYKNIEDHTLPKVDELKKIGELKIIEASKRLKKVIGVEIDGVQEDFIPKDDNDAFFVLTSLINEDSCKDLSEFINLYLDGQKKTS